MTTQSRRRWSCLFIVLSLTLQLFGSPLPELARELRAAEVASGAVDAKQNAQIESDVLSYFRQKTAREGKGGKYHLVREPRKVDELNVTAKAAEQEKIQAITSLRFEKYLVDDVDLKQLVKLPYLEEVSIVGPFTDGGLAQLAQVKNLKCLTVHSPYVTDVGCQILKDVASLQELDIRNTAITGKGVASLDRLKNLRKLVLPLKREITDADLRHVEGLTELRILDLNDCSVTDTCIARLAGLKHLEFLGLAGTRITDDSLEHLQAMPNLKVINLDGTLVSEVGISKLRNAKPELVIIGK